MVINDEYNALTPEDRAMNIIRKCFKEERNGDLNARKRTIEDLKNFLVKTDDGSYTLNSNECAGKSETMHTRHGALTESMEKFVKPAYLVGKKEVNVLDVCSGLGYNAASCIDYLDSAKKINIDMVEISLETLAAALLIENPIKSYEIIKEAIEGKLYQEKIIEFRFHKITDERVNINILIEDARKIETENKYDAIFLDAFSPAKCPELYSFEFFIKLRDLLKEDGVILTYTSAAPVRSAMVKAGFHVGEGPQFGRKSGGTVASKSFKNIKKQLSINDERMIALSDAGIPFRDFQMVDSSEKIMKRRENERKSARGFIKLASTVKTPLFLFSELEDSRLKRRVLRNLNKLGIDNLKSKEAAFITCPQFEECICDCGIGRLNNSKDRINEMEKRLEIIIKKDYKF
ncbi:tRNA (5-methylaminomethyl-2-thiouridine)(34)-methyltransferase MnmD [Methanobacterium sp. ACI-7]|uniref:tRNA (5-methylaminomethyl-2-thiouridine)(34)-methyltransferase MnmD n=1 Tax=unclassified Methanobacterium TaxID=2627676 RepID=UPI0039C15F4A